MGAGEESEHDLLAHKHVRRANDTTGKPDCINVLARTHTCARESLVNGAIVDAVGRLLALHGRLKPDERKRHEQLLWRRLH